MTLIGKPSGGSRATSRYIGARRSITPPARAVLLVFDRRRQSLFPQIKLPSQNPSTMPSQAESKRSANLGILDQGGSLVRSRGSHMVGRTAGAGSPPIKVDTVLQRNPAAGLSIRASRPPESTLRLHWGGI
jgi:hypothetical protein